jgi:hypothetical protein
MKICSFCKEEKEDSDFYSKGKKNKTSSYCKKCFNIYCGGRWIKRKLDMIRLKNSKCEDCNLEANDKNYYLFDFHHNDPSKKDMVWERMRKISLKSCIQEVQKCALLCCMCHRTRHFLEKDW